MIRNIEPISIAEVVEYIKTEDAGEEILGFIKKFTVLDSKKAKELRKKLEGLGLMRIKQENIIKIVDLMPENADDLNKIFAGVALEEDEKKKILETVKEFK